MTALRRLGALLLLVLVLATGCRAGGPGAAPEAQKAPTLRAAWVQLGPDGAVLARAIADGPDCPSLQVEGGPRAMRERAAPAPPAFPERVCEIELPAGAASAAIAGRPLALPRANPRRVAIIGDTGCRVAADGRGQACNDPRQWPFAEIARRAAEWQPDLVIHVGDYLYREAPCPPGNAGCAGTPWGDNWAAWDADLFAPAAPLLRAAPWVFVRGNHELCARGGDGWFRWLEPRALPAACVDFTDPYAIPLGDLQLLLLDSSAADDFEARPEQVAHYAAQLGTLDALATDNAWLLTHRPLWAVGHQGEDAGQEVLFRTNPTLQAASGNALPPGVKLVQAGHLHIFELLSFYPPRPPQMVVGNSGTTLDPSITSSLVGVEVAGVMTDAGTATARFGYLAMERDGTGWQATLRGLNDEPEEACTIGGGRARCAP